jgi:signal recognition particle GTPase
MTKNKKFRVVVYHSIPAITKETENKKKLQTMESQVTEYQTIQSGMTWQEAKELRKINTHYMIVPENS